MAASGPLEAGLAGRQPRPLIQQHVNAAGNAQQAILGSGTMIAYFGMAAVPLSVAEKDPRPVFAAARVGEFVGRDWLVGQVDDFLARNECGYVLVQADAGMGKTAFAAWLASSRGYVSHFSRYSDGGLTRVALANLSAQLITRFGLESELAPGGMLPQWAETSDGFESVLGRATERARAAGEKLVLVIDGLDEAETAGNGLPGRRPG